MEPSGRPAGRIGFCDLTGFCLDEIGELPWTTLWERGGFPRSTLQPDRSSSAMWRGDFVRTFFERDLSALGIRVPPEALRRFFRMIAHYHGQFSLWTKSRGPVLPVGARAAMPSSPGGGPAWPPIR